MSTSKTSYWLPPIDVRQNYELSSLNVTVRGIYRDLLDLMWLTSSKCSLPMKLDTIAERLNTDVETLSKAIDTLSEGSDPLIRIEDTPFGKYLLSEFLRLQKGGVERPDYIKVKESKVVAEEIPLKQEPLKSYLYRRYITPDEALVTTKFDGWMPTSRFVVDGEAFVLNPEVVDTIKREAGDVNLDIVFDRAFNWLMSVNNEHKRPTYASMTAFLIGFAKKSVKSKKVLPLAIQQDSTNYHAMSDEEFEAEIVALFEAENAGVLGGSND